MSVYHMIQCTYITQQYTWAHILEFKGFTIRTAFINLALTATLPHQIRQVISIEWLTKDNLTWPTRPTKYASPQR